jgi:alpha-L-rhamnosidase
MRGASSGIGCGYHGAMEMLSLTGECKGLKFVRNAVVLLLVCGQPGSAQTPSPNLRTSYWPAQWISCPQAPPRDLAVCHLRRDFTVNAVPAQALVYVSADNRYQLFLNGQPISRGPSRGDLDHWRFETVDLAPQLHSGRNVLAAVVWNYGNLAPMAQMSDQTGFLLQAGPGANPDVDTNRSWKTLLDASRRPLQISGVNDYYAAGTGERVDGASYPWGWQDESYDTAAWLPAAEEGHAGPRGMSDTHSRWMLVSDTLPPQTEAPQRFARVVRSEGVTIPPEFLAGNAPLTIPANTTATILLDQSVETTAYPQLVVSGGQGSRVRVVYAEALVAPDGTKGNRNDTDGKSIHGIADEFLPDGGEHRTFATLWWRAWRYVQLEIHTGNAPLTLEDFRSAFTSYPFREAARFKSNDADLDRIREVGWRTALLCAHETYMDSPYYEQLQYIGDTRIQGLISLYITGDDRLLKNAVELLGDSQTPEGLTQSRYPTALPQYIPGFSLLWVGMLHDLWWYDGQRDLVAPWLPNARAVLGWYERHLAPTGLLGRLEWWPFVDWADQFPGGVPPHEADGQSAAQSLQLAMALEEAADLESAFGQPSEAQRDRALAAKIDAAVFHLCWDGQRHLLADTPQKGSFSQQTNTLGVLTGAIPPALQAQTMERTLRDSSLTQASYYFQFYLFRAMRKAGLGDRYLEQLKPWRQMLSDGLSTFAETPGNPRSDCHAWSAHPLIDLLATVAGIEPAAPGFARIRIAPHLGELRTLEASMPSPHGTVTANYRLAGGKLTADLTLPSGVTGEFVWNGHTVALHAGVQHIEVPVGPASTRASLQSAAGYPPPQG